jgi:uncharacterized protein with HEPN domain
VRSDRDRLLDIIEAIERIERYATVGQARFAADELLQTWVVHHIQIIGEAARKLSDGFRNAHPEIAWQQIIAMRNILVHDYFGIDVDEVWNTAQRDLPPLKRDLAAILEQLPPDR